tara:strand:+ start:1080 stop:2321 length:1242 start_codon:yes stop_codon:yes gene_type:complete
MISYKKALKILHKSKLKLKNEKVKLHNSLHRICAENIFSRYNYPAANNTALDGFAINSRETTIANKNNKVKFRILKTLAAGDNPKLKKIKNHSCLEVMTGAVIKKPFDTIIPYEDSKIVKEKKIKYLLVDKKIRAFNHIRFAGSDIKKRQIIQKKGDFIKASDILVLKTLGVSKIKVKKKINIVFFSTGNEITNHTLIQSWKVRNSNGSYINSFSKVLPIKIQEKGILKDNDEKKFLRELKKCIENQVDLVMTIGGVSAGKYDFVPSVIDKFKKKLYFKNSKIRPGKPILFSKLNEKTAFFGLPGNPVSTAACFRFFVLPFIFKSNGYAGHQPIKAKLKDKFKKDKKFTRFIKGILKISKNGTCEFKLLKGQESFKIKPLAKSNVWGQFNDGKTTFNKGELIDCHTTFGVNFL